VCAGAAHTYEVAKVLEQIGYGKIKHVGLSAKKISFSFHFDEDGKMIPRKMSGVNVVYGPDGEILDVQWPDPISVKKLFGYIAVPVFRPLNGTSQIIKNQIRCNYNVVFPLL